MLLIKNVNVIPMNKEIVLENMDVLIDKGVIKAIDKNIVSESGEVIDGEGKYLLPGLCDMHTHINSDDHFNMFLSHGVTTIRNMWGNSTIQKWSKEVLDLKRIGPDIYTTGPLTDGLEFWTGANVVKTVEEAEAVVEMNKAEGYDTIKTYPDIPRDAFIALMKKAKDEGLKVVGHPDRNVTVDELIELGYHSIEHASLLPKDYDDVKKVAEAGIWFSPTLVVVKAMLIHAKEGIDVKQMEGYDYVNAREQKEWDELIEAMSKIPRMQAMDLEELYGRAKVFMKYSDNVLLGTDNANPGVVAGLDLHRELKIHVEDIGLTPFEALRTGTVNPARYLGLENTTGTIETGKEATLILLEANPLENINNTSKISHVIKKGQVFDKQSLNKLKEDVLAMKVEDMEFALGSNELNVD